MTPKLPGDCLPTVLTGGLSSIWHVTVSEIIMPAHAENRLNNVNITSYSNNGHRTKCNGNQHLGQPLSTCMLHTGIHASDVAEMQA